MMDDGARLAEIMEREKFEAENPGDFDFERNEHGQYASRETYLAFAGWLARATSSSLEIDRLTVKITNAEASHLETIDERDRLKGEIARLREALEPFAEAADIKLCGEWHDGEHFGRTDVAFHLTFGDLRKARAALQTDGGKL